MKTKTFKSLTLLSAFGATTCLSNAIALAWGDFSDVPDTGGAAGGPYSIDNAKGGGALTFQADYTEFDTDGTANYFASGGTRNDAFTWSDAESDGLSLIGYRGTNYTFSFSDISSSDGSLYLGAGAFEDDNLLGISAFDSSDSPVSLIGSLIVGDWTSSGSGGNQTWVPSLSGGVLSTPRGSNSGVNMLIDLSNRGIARLDFTYTDSSGGNVRSGDRWHVDLAGNAATSSIPEPGSTLLTILGASAVFLRRRRS